jgi:predicted  nucleic acid-binding Zn-ribbon protein
MPSGEATIAELDRLTSGLMGAGKNADFFQQAIKQVSADLAAATAASESANAALAAGQAEYANLERAALQAAKAAEKAAQRGNGDEMLEMATKAMQAESALNEYTETLRRLEKDASGAAKSEEELGQTLANVKKLSGHVNTSLGAQAESLEKLGGAMGAVGGPLGQLGQQVLRPIQGFSKLSSSIGGAKSAALLGAVGFAALAAAVVAIGVAAVAATVKVAAWAVSLGDAARNAGIAEEAFAAANPELAQFNGLIADLDAETLLGAGALRKLAKSLQAAKVSAEDMPQALAAAAIAEKALGDEGGAQPLIDRIKEGTLSLEEFADTANGMQGIVSKRLRSLDEQGKRFKKNIGDLFGGLNIEPVLSALETMVALFDKNEASGQAIKFLFETIFQPLIDNATNAAYVVEAFFLGFLIGALKLYIGLKPTIKAIEEFFGFEDSSLSDTLKSVTEAGEVLAPIILAIALAWGLAVVAVTALVAVVLALGAALIALPIILYKVGAAVFGGIVDAFNTAVEFIKGLDFLGMGRDIMTGLAAGITGAASAVWNAITGAVKGAIGAAKSLLGISSPSKVFAELGEFTGEGMTLGVESTANDVQAAMGEMASPESALQAATSPAGGGGAAVAPAAAADPAAGGAGGGLDLTGVTFIFQGVKDAEQAEGRFRELLTMVVKGDAAALGAAKAAA